MKSQDELMENVRLLLDYDAHSRRYQSIPDFVTQRIGRAAADYSSEQLAWDEPRYAWIDANLPREVTSAVELGSSLGYFSLRLSYERKIEVTGYERVNDYAQACNLFTALTGLDERARYLATPIGLDDVQQLPEADVLISLNVLHHAGNIFDADAVAARGGWMPYAADFLHQALKNFRYLVFQTGNSIKGVAHFPSVEAVPVTTDLLCRSGWTVQCIGIVTDFQKCTYKSFKPIDMDRIPRIGCRRNARSDLVEYFENGNLIAELPYGTLQRPLFFCSRS